MRLSKFKILKIRILYFTFILLCTWLNISGQEPSGQLMPTIIPPSPNASSLMKFTETPVSYYTGLPSINIPIHTISSVDIQVPISLSYHARGIKVEEIASRVGIGWTLNAGGTISRQIRGKADDDARGYLTNDDYDIFFTSELKRQRTYQDVINDLVDLQPDQFFFNFLGFSGKFIYDRITKTPIIQSFSDIKINTIGPGSDIQGFEIIDEQGFKYYFGVSEDGLRTSRDNEQTLGTYISSLNKGDQSFSGSDSARKHSSWHLLDIVSPTREQVNFIYDQETITTFRRTRDVREKVNSTIETRAHFSEVQTTQNHIQEIRFKNGVVVFNKDINEREDLRGGHSLNNIEIKSIAADKNIVSESLVKKFIFNYSYTNSPGNNDVLSYLDINEPKADKRMFLDSIQQVNGIESIPPYEFTYSSIKLPNRFSNSQDIWGHYNGKNNGQFLAFFNNNGVTPLDRRVDTLNVQAGLLKQIKYPTGGYVNYEYESNKAVPPYYFKNIKTNGTNPTVDKGVAFDKDRNFLNPDGTYSFPFTVGENLVGYDADQDNSAPNNIFIEITDPENKCGSTETVDCPYLIRWYKSTGELIGPLLINRTKIPLKPGDYIIKVIPTGVDDPDDFENSFSVIIQWKEKVQSENEIYYTAGNRIKTITLDDSRGNTITKRYEYKSPGGKSSGKVFSLPEYFYTSLITINGQTYREYHAILYKSANSLTLEQGNHGGYAYVTEYTEGNEGVLGKTEYSFTTYYDSGEFYKPTYHIPTDNEWLRGDPLETNYYKYSNNEYSLVRKVVNEYEYGGEEDGIYQLTPDGIYQYKDANNVPYINRHDRYIVPLVIFSAPNPLDYDSIVNVSDLHNFYKIHFLTGGLKHLSATHQIDYYNGSTISTSTLFKRGSNEHYQITEKEVHNSTGDSHITKTYYPGDINSISSLGYKNLSLPEFNTIQSLRRPTSSNPNYLHKVATPIQIETVVKNSNGELISNTAQRTLFRNWDDNLVLPEFIQTLKGEYHATNNHIENRIQYHQYDSNGNPLEVSKTNGSHIVYLWGYNDQYPIAKIENATFTEVATALGITTEVLKTYDETKLIQINGLRNSLPKAMVTTYTYEPLIGMSSVTDPRGYTMTYHYDEFNRLEFVKDQDGNLVSENKYNYKN